jgi:hypothetical protein
MESIAQDKAGKSIVRKLGMDSTRKLAGKGKSNASR